VAGAVSCGPPASNVCPYPRSLLPGPHTFPKAESIVVALELKLYRSPLKATSISKSKSDSIAERVQQIVLSFIVLVAYPKAFDMSIANSTHSAPRPEGIADSFGSVEPPLSEAEHFFKCPLCGGYSMRATSVGWTSIKSCCPPGVRLDAIALFSRETTLTEFCRAPSVLSSGVARRLLIEAVQLL
jgi:hypothetical protein